MNTCTHTVQLETRKEKDLGILNDIYLMFEDHISEKTNKANHMICISRTFVYVNAENF